MHELVYGKGKDYRMVITHLVNMGVSPNHPFVHRCFHYFHHPFGGTGYRVPLNFGNTHIYLAILNMPFSGPGEFPWPELKGCFSWPTQWSGNTYKKVTAAESPASFFQVTFTQMEVTIHPWKGHESNLLFEWSPAVFWDKRIPPGKWRESLLNGYIM